jgi:PAS domain S-box-containing protein
MEVTLRQVCEQIGWDFGEFWLPNSQATVFELGDGWYGSDRSFVKFRRESKPLTFATQREFLRQICQSRQPGWIADISVEPSNVFQRNQLAGEAGLKACLAVPILFDNQVLAVLVFMKREASEPELRLIELVNALAAQLGSLIQRKRSESALRQSQEQLAAMAANIPGCMYRGVVHADGKVQLLYMSEGEHELSGLNPREAMGQLERFLETTTPDSQADFYRALRAAAESPKPLAQEYSIAAPDGTVKWVRNITRYSLMENGDVMVDGVAIDISDRVAAEERLQHLEQALAAERNGQ